MKLRLYIYAISAIALVAASSCARRVTQKDESVKTDSTSVSRILTDCAHTVSSIENKEQHVLDVLDSTYTKDSIHTIEHADGTKETFRFRDTYRIRATDKANSMSTAIRDSSANSVHTSDSIFSSSKETETRSVSKTRGTCMRWPAIIIGTIFSLFLLITARYRH